MKKLVLVMIALMLVLVGTSAYAEGTKVGVGYEMNFDIMSNITVRTWVDKIGASVTYGETITDVKNQPRLDTEVRQYDGRLMFAPIVKEYGRFFVGGKIGKIETEIYDEDFDVIIYGAFVGAELSSSEVPNINLFWTVGYTWVEDDDIDMIDFEVKGTDVSIGMCWYF